MKVPESRKEFREWQRLGRFRTIREDAGISGETIAAAIGVNHTAVYEWELASVPLSAPVWASYMRVIRGLMNHLEIRLPD